MNFEEKINTCATAYAHNIICSTNWTDQLVVVVVVVVVVFVLLQLAVQ